MISRGAYLLTGLGETKRPGMVDQEHIAVLGHAFTRQDESALLHPVFTRLNPEETPSIEHICGQLLEKQPVQRCRNPCRCQQHSMHLLKLLETHHHPHFLPRPQLHNAYIPILSLSFSSSRSLSHTHTHQRAQCALHKQFRV